MNIFWRLNISFYKKTKQNKIDFFYASSCMSLEVA